MVFLLFALLLTDFDSKCGILTMLTKNTNHLTVFGFHGNLFGKDVKFEMGAFAFVQSIN